MGVFDEIGGLLDPNRAERKRQQANARRTSIPAARPSQYEAERNVVVASSELPSGAATSANQYAQRPSEKTGRTHVQANVSAATSDTTLHTVTAGKTLYVTSAFVQGHNDQTVNTTRAGIQKNDNTKILLEVNIGVNVVGQVAPSAGLALSFQEPYQYAAGEVVQLNIASDGVWSAGIVGYEE